MDLTKVSKKELRDALWNYNNIISSFKGCPQSEIMRKKYLGCEVIDAEFGTYHIKSGNVTVALAYDLSDDTNPTFMHSFKIDGLEELIMADDIEEFFNDYKGKFQKEFFENLDLKPIELYLKELIGTEVTFEKTILLKTTGSTTSYKLELKSQDVKEHCGIFGHILSNANIETFGSIQFYISNTGSQELSIPGIEIRYQHKDGGNNGMFITKDLQYDLETFNWIVPIFDNGFKFYALKVENGKLVKEAR